jgi:hypothetical protein
MVFKINPVRNAIKYIPKNHEWKGRKKSLTIREINPNAIRVVPILHFGLRTIAILLP